MLKGHKWVGKRLSAVIRCPCCKEFAVRYVFNQGSGRYGKWSCSSCGVNYDDTDEGRRLMSDRPSFR